LYVFIMNRYLSLILILQVFSVFPYKLMNPYHPINSYLDIRNAESNKIVGGSVVADENDYPFQVYFLAGGTKRLCGGTIINKNHVITADHCLLGWTPNDMTFVIVGEHRVLYKDVISSSAERIFGSNLIRVERFIKRNDNKDIAILRLARDIQFTDRIQPACIPGRNDENYAGWNADVTGWGGTVGYNPGQGVYQRKSDVLKETTLNVLNPYSDLCIIAGGYGDHELCAYNQGTDSCQGDSGGPLTVRENGKSVLIGVVSNGKGCASTGHAGIYARVSYFTEWIKENVGDVCTSDDPINPRPYTSRPNTPRPYTSRPNTPRPYTTRPNTPRPYSPPNSSGTGYMSTVKCGICQAWDSNFCTPGEVTTADSCSNCPTQKGWYYCAGGGDCKVKRTGGVFRKCVPVHE